MGKLFLVGAFLCLSACEGKSFAQAKQEQPLDLTFRGMSVGPRILPFQEKVTREENQSLAPDARKKIILLPAVELRTPEGVPLTLSTRRSKGITWINVGIKW